jgi:hypothetical protein
MNEYMITITILSPFNKEFASLIPEQRVQVNRLMEKGILTRYSVSADRRMLWMTILAALPEDVEKTLRTMPLFKFMRYEIVEMMFDLSPVFAPTHFSMN